MTATESAVLTLIGVVCIGAGTFLTVYIVHIRSRGFRAFAQVLSIKQIEKQIDEGQTYSIYKPLLEIIGERGNWKAEWLSGATALSQIGTSWDSYHEGEVLQVYYLPQTKQIFTIKHLKQVLQIGLILCGIGFLTLLAVHLNRGFW